MRLSALARLCAVLLLGSPVLLACDGDKPNTRHPSGEDDDELGDGELDGSGPGGIGQVTAGMADADPRVVEAEALLGDGKYQRALETIDAAIAENPSHARFHYVRGNALSYLDRDDEARAAYKKAIELDDTDALPHAGLGNLIAFQDNATLDHRRESVPHFQAALKLDPNLAAAHQALGVVLLSLGDLQAAIEALETADRLAGNVETAYLLAQAHAELGNDEKALGFAKSAIEYEPDASGVDLRLLYARLLLKAGQPKEAAIEFERAGKLAPDSAMVHMKWLLEAAPDQPPILVNYGRILIAQGKPKDAIAQLDRALELQPDSQAAATYRIEALVAAKRCKDARAQFDALAKQLGWTKGSDQPPPRALAKGQGFLDAGKCK
jgi:tetratricopeptide (TPR) repeat protein